MSVLMRKKHLPSTLMDNVVVSVGDRLSDYFHLPRTLMDNVVVSVVDRLSDDFHLPRTLMDNAVVSVVVRLSDYFHSVPGQRYMLLVLTECYYDKGKKRKCRN